MTRLQGGTQNFALLQRGPPFQDPAAPRHIQVEELEQGQGAHRSEQPAEDGPSEAVGPHGEGRADGRAREGGERGGAEARDESPEGPGANVGDAGHPRHQRRGDSEGRGEAHGR